MTVRPTKCLHGSHAVLKALASSTQAVRLREPVHLELLRQRQLARCPLDERGRKIMDGAWCSRRDRGLQRIATPMLCAQLPVEH